MFSVNFKLCQQENYMIICGVYVHLPTSITDLTRNILGYILYDLKFHWEMYLWGTPKHYGVYIYFNLSGQAAKNFFIDDGQHHYFMSIY
jgi:hypothetical protein